ncbi:zinc finger FYVE domain-containing protein 26-like [Aplochiton taeniatus]
MLESAPSQASSTAGVCSVVTSDYSSVTKERAAMHPPSCDAESSLQELFGYFNRCLQHGEWELASACVQQLVDSTGGLSEHLQDIVKAIVTYPYLLQWESVGSPHKLAWFWLQILEKRTKQQVPPTIRRELEFLLLLEELGDDVPGTVLKELHQAFVDTQLERKSPGTQRTNVTLGAGVESCLQGLMETKRPRLAQALAQFLQGPSGEHTLQHIFIRFTMDSVGKLGPEQAEEGRMEKICSVLAVMPWSLERGGGQLEALCEALWTARDGLLWEERVLSALTRPHCHGLLSLYCSTALRLHRDHLLRDSPTTQGDLPEAVKLLLSLSCHEDRPSVWKTIYFECLSSGKHFLEQVLVTALDLVKREEFSWLEDLLKAEFQPLSRLLLLLGWTQCQSLSSAETLLRILHHQQAVANDSVLREFANSLSTQLGVLKWCATNHPGISVEALVAQLHTLDNHSALYVLHSLTPLAQFDEHRVLNLLQQLPRTLEAG